MITFLPFPDFYRSAKALDDKRLGKQRVEAVELLKGKYSNNPASEMWLPNYGEALAEYALIMCQEWVYRGNVDNLRRTIELKWSPIEEPEMPNWFGQANLHRSHRVALLCKLPNWYSRIDGFQNDIKEAERLMRTNEKYRYVWPTREVV